MGVSAAGFRYWWRLLHGTDANLENAHLMRMASRFSRCLRAWAKAHQVPLVDCSAAEPKHEIAAQYLSTREVKPGLFMILVARAPALVWDVQMSGGGKIGNIERKKPRPYVNHYHFHILDAEWGHVTIKMSGHPLFGAQVMLNGHEYVACAARQRKIEFTKNGNCLTDTADAGGLAAVADTLSQQRTIGRLSQLCERWIYSSCLLFALNLEEQKRSEFQYQYSICQMEYSRHRQFWAGGQMEQVFQSLIDRTRAPLGWRRVKTIFGSKKRPCRRQLREGRYGVVVETPAYELTVFKVHYGKLTLKIYSKGEGVLRIEAVVHNTKELCCGRSLPNCPKMVELLRGMLERLLNTLHCLDVCCIADDTLEKLGSASRLARLSQNRASLAQAAGLTLGPDTSRVLDERSVGIQRSSSKILTAWRCSALKSGASITVARRPRSWLRTRTKVAFTSASVFIMLSADCRVPSAKQTRLTSVRPITVANVCKRNELSAHWWEGPQGAPSQGGILQAMDSVASNNAGQSFSAWKHLRQGET